MIHKSKFHRIEKNRRTDIFSETFYKALEHEGVTSIVSWSDDEPPVTCTWNPYLVVQEPQILIPATGMNSTQADVEKQSRVKVTLGSREVMGRNNYQGTGFEINGTAEFIAEGDQYELMKEKYPFLRRVLVVNVESLKQLL